MLILETEPFTEMCTGSDHGIYASISDSCGMQYVCLCWVVGGHICLGDDQSGFA